MTCPTRDLTDAALEAHIDKHFAPTKQAERDNSRAALVAEQCAAMLNAYVDGHLDGFAYRPVAAGLRELAASMLRMGAPA